MRAIPNENDFLSELGAFRQEMAAELNDLTDWWINHMMDSQYGGFFGRMDGFGEIHPTADKGVILNTRLLWTFSAAAKYSGDKIHKEFANRAFNYLEKHFWDTDNGGVFWMVDHRGTPIQRQKQIYAQAFALYAFCEYYDLTGSPRVLTLAQSTFDLIEEHSRDQERGGYVNVFSVNWQPLADQRLSSKDENQAKIMNTHLHIMEAYTSFHRVSPGRASEKALRYVLGLIQEKFCARQPRHLYLFFDEDWKATSLEKSFGHDIECAWLLIEAAEVLGDESILDRSKTLSIELAESTLIRGLDPAGGVFEHTDSSGTYPIPDKHWWPQAEAVVGFLQAWQISNQAKFWQASLASWEFIKAHFKDTLNGEWHWLIDERQRPVLNREDKAGPWKAPYHNVRMCLEVLKRTPSEVAKRR